MISNNNYRYKIYGLNIESEIILPELEELDQSQLIDVHISIGTTPEKIQGYIKKGKRSKYRKNDMWFHINNVATYMITKGKDIVIEPVQGASPGEIKKFILGSCLGMILIQRNIVAIHGGTIVINDKAVVLTGDSGAGKSTLTAAFRVAGHKFLSDDVAATITDLDNMRQPMVCPGYPRQKLCIDAMYSMYYDYNEFDLIDENRNKYSIPTNESFISKNLPLGVIVEISTGDNDKVEIQEVVGFDKIDFIMKNIYRVEITRKSGIYEKYFENIMHIVKEVPFYKLVRPKDKLTVKEQINLIKNIGVL